MPIYAYKCDACGHAKDVLQKMSDPQLVVCPVCGQSEFKKQLTAAGFQLKGSGWYVTDFREGGAKSGTPSADQSTGTKEQTVAEPASTNATAKVSAGESSSSAAASSSPTPSPAVTSAAPAKSKSTNSS